MKPFYFLILALLINTGCGSSGGTTTTFDPPYGTEPLDFDLVIFQDGKKQVIKDQESIQLKKEDFSIDVAFNQMQGIYMNLCTDYNPDFASGKRFEAFESIPFQALAGSPGNEDNELIVNCESYNYWRTENGANYSFNSYKRYGPIQVGTLSVSNFYFSDTEENLDVSELNQPLYMYIVAVRKDEADGRAVDLLKSHYFQINWLETQ